MLDDIKTISVSPDGNATNEALIAYLSIIGINVDLTKTTLSDLNDIVGIRVSQLPKLQEAYTVIMLGRNIRDLLNEEASINSLSIENIADKAKNLYSFDVINDEQMARVYYNIGQLYTKYELNKGYNADKVKASKYIDRYALKALSLTGDIEMIKACINDISPEASSKRIELTLEACERALKKPTAKEALKRFQIYSLCGECYQEKALATSVGYNKNNNNYRHAAIYYQAALRYSLTPDDTQKTLRNLSKAYRRYDHEKYITTRLSLLTYLEGKDKVTEALKISSDENIDSKKKEKVLEVAANELIDSSMLPDEKMLLWQNIRMQLKKSYGTNKKKLDNLIKVDHQYFNHKEKSGKRIISTKSSKGNNHFGR